MATGMTKTALVRHMAEKLAVTNKQSATFLDLLAETAVKEETLNVSHGDAFHYCIQTTHLKNRD